MQPSDVSFVSSLDRSPQLTIILPPEFISSECTSTVLSKSPVRADQILAAECTCVRTRRARDKMSVRTAPESHACISSGKQQGGNSVKSLESQFLLEPPLTRFINMQRFDSNSYPIQVDPTQFTTVCEEEKRTREVISF